MPDACGLIKSESNKLVGTFDIDGSPHHLSITVKTLGPEFNCSNATLTYKNLEKLIERGSWSGSIGKTDLRLTFRGDAFITGELDAPRPSCSRVYGEGRWGADAASFLSPDSVNEIQEHGSNTSGNQFRPLDAVKDPVKLERERQLLESGDPIIAIFGQSGVGKSTFINLISSRRQDVSEGLQSCTSQISVLEARIGGKPVVVIDTPGVDDTRPGMKEADFLVGVARRLKAMELKGIRLTGVLFLHRITDNKFSPTASRIATMLKTICGDFAMSHFMLCTTMWDKVSLDEGEKRFEELRETGVWREMIAKGASTVTMSSTTPTAKADAERIICELIKNVQPVGLAIQDEMTAQGKTLAQTGAGRFLTEYLREAQEEAEHELQEEEDSMLKEDTVSGEKVESLLAQEREVERPGKLTMKQSRASRANVERPLQEQQKTESDMVATRRGENTGVERSGQRNHARRHGLENTREGVEAQTHASHQAELDRAERDKEKMREKIIAEIEANAAKVQARRREIKELRRQNEKLKQEQPPYPWWAVSMIGATVVTVAVVAKVPVKKVATEAAAVIAKMPVLKVVAVAAEVSVQLAAGEPVDEVLKGAVDKVFGQGAKQ